MRPKWKYLQYALCLAILSSAAGAADLNAPAHYQPTIGSEIKRGGDTIIRCQQGFDWRQYVICVDEIMTGEPKATDAFKLGLNFTAQWYLNDIKREAWLRVTGEDLSRNDLFRSVVTLYKTSYQSLKKKLGITNNEICRARGGQACHKVLD
jgi:hypothetical protein